MAYEIQERTGMNILYAYQARKKILREVDAEARQNALASEQ
jgi:hypothetical protein